MIAKILKVFGWIVLAVLFAIIAVGYVALAPQTRSYRFSLIVKDFAGKELGRGVWEYAQWNSIVPNTSEALAGAAFPIKLPSGRRAFVLRNSESWITSRRGNGGISANALYKSTPELLRAIPKVPDKMFPSLDSRTLASLMFEMGKIDRQFELSLGMEPMVVSFDDENDPRSVRAVDDGLRFYFQATRSRLSPGVEKILPWLVDQHPRDPKKKIWPGTTLDGGDYPRDTAWKDAPLSQRIGYADFWLGGWSNNGGFKRW